MAASFKRKEPCFVISFTDFDEFGANCCCFGCTESIADGFDYIRSQGYLLDVKVKQNDVKIPILGINSRFLIAGSVCFFLKFVLQSAEL